jgi:hypothetical protein
LNCVCNGDELPVSDRMICRLLGIEMHQLFFSKELNI